MDNPSVQHFLLLDEMRIARVKYYFAEALSVLEQHMAVAAPLHSVIIAPREAEPLNQVVWPSNPCIIGTINVDETTFTFFRKVLDRAFVIEFDQADLSAFDEGTQCRTRQSGWQRTGEP